MAASEARSDWFRRLVLPGLAFKAMVIGGGYATGREMAEFFMPGGTWGGIFGMLLATAMWSLICILTFLFSYSTQSFDYRSFFKSLLGRFWFAFEVAFGLSAVIILSVYGAAAGAIVNALLDWPIVLGTLGLMLVVTAFAAFGSDSVERLFKYVSFLLYGVYLLFVIFAFSSFGESIKAHLSAFEIRPGWALNGLSYGGYNLLGAVLILPALRHVRTRRDAVVAGLLSGPLAMAPALLFYVVMVGFPELINSDLPSDVLLSKLGHPLFRALFQIMIFFALVESSTGCMHAINQRVSSSLGGSLSIWRRTAISLAILSVCMLLASRFGLVSLISSGYRFLAILLMATYIVPLLTIGIYKLSIEKGVRMKPSPANRAE